MRPTGPKLDKYGFPIAPDFDAAGVEDPGRGGSSIWPWLQPVLKLSVIAVVLAGVWLHFDLGAKFGAAFSRYHAQQAMAAVVNGKYDDALAASNRALSWNPDSVELLGLRARIQYRLNRYDESLADVERALAIKDNDEEMQSLRLHMLHVMHRYREASAAASEMLQRNIGPRPTVLNSRAYARAVGKFELEEALADIEEAMSQNDENAAFIDTRGYVLFRLGRNEEALADIERAIELTHQEQEQLERLAPLQRNNPVGNMMRDQQMAELEASLAEMYYHRGEIHEELGDAAQAAKDFMTGIQLGFQPPRQAD